MGVKFTNRCHMPCRGNLDGVAPPSHLENSFNAKIERHFTNTETDVLAQFLLDKRNLSTRKAYAKGLNVIIHIPPLKRKD